MENKEPSSDGKVVPVGKKQSLKPTVFKIVIVAMVVLSVLAIAVFLTGMSSSAKYREIWRDDFNGNQLDQSKWYFGNIGCSGNGNNEMQCYTDRNAKVENGLLVINVKIEPGNGGKQFSSSRIHGKQGFVYGKFEARAKLPKGRHLWPAVWMMPLKSEFGEWPRSGEIDIMEHRGQVSDSVEGTIHYGDRGHIYEGSSMRKFPFDFSRDFHVFAIERTPTKIAWSVDGKEYYSYNTDKMFGNNIYKNKGEPFNKEFYWIFNVAVGGGYFPENPFGPPVTTDEARRWEKTTMEVDWVKVSKLV